ncbi:pol [Symbiodinium sp. KB8]|nr:pol [Symbiodinium sp. KB8]
MCAPGEDGRCVYWPSSASRADLAELFCLNCTIGGDEGCSGPLCGTMCRLVDGKCTYHPSLSAKPNVEELYCMSCPYCGYEGSLRYFSTKRLEEDERLVADLEAMKAKTDKQLEIELGKIEQSNNETDAANVVLSRSAVSEHSATRADQQLDGSVVDLISHQALEAYFLASTVAAIYFADGRRQLQSGRGSAADRALLERHHGSMPPTQKPASATASKTPKGRGKGADNAPQTSRIEFALPQAMTTSLQAITSRSTQDLWGTPTSIPGDLSVEQQAQRRASAVGKLSKRISGDLKAKEELRTALQQWVVTIAIHLSGLVQRVRALEDKVDTDLGEAIREMKDALSQQPSITTAEQVTVAEEAVGKPVWTQIQEHEIFRVVSALRAFGVVEVPQRGADITSEVSFGMAPPIALAPDVMDADMCRLSHFGSATPATATPEVGLTTLGDVASGARAMVGRSLGASAPSHSGDNTSLSRPSRWRKRSGVENSRPSKSPRREVFTDVPWATAATGTTPEALQRPQHTQLVDGPEVVSADFGGMSWEAAWLQLLQFATEHGSIHVGEVIRDLQQDTVLPLQEQNPEGRGELLEAAEDVWLAMTAATELQEPGTVHNLCVRLQELLNRLRMCPSAVSGVRQGTLLLAQVTVGNLLDPYSYAPTTAQEWLFPTAIAEHGSLARGHIATQPSAAQAMRVLLAQRCPALVQIPEDGVQVDLPISGRASTESEQPTVLISDDRVHGLLLHKMVCSAYGLAESEWQLRRLVEGWFHPTARLLLLPYGDAFQVWPMHRVPSASLTPNVEEDDAPATLEDRFSTSLSLPAVGELAFHDLSGANAVILHAHGHTYACVPSYSDHLTLRSSALSAVAVDLQIQPRGRLCCARILPPLDRMPAIQFVAAYCEDGQVLGVVDLRPSGGGVYVTQVREGATPAERIAATVQRHGEPSSEMSLASGLAQGRLQVLHREHVVDPFAPLHAAPPAPVVVLSRRSHLASGYRDPQLPSDEPDILEDATLGIAPDRATDASATTRFSGGTSWGSLLSLLLFAPRWLSLLTAKVRLGRGDCTVWDPSPADRGLHYVATAEDTAIVTVIADTGREYLCLDVPRIRFGSGLLSAVQLLCPDRCFRIADSIRTPVRHGDVIRLFDEPMENCRSPQFYVPRFTYPPSMEPGTQLVYIASVDMGMIRLKVPVGVETHTLEQALVVWLGYAASGGIVVVLAFTTAQATSDTDASDVPSALHSSNASAGLIAAVNATPDCSSAWCYELSCQSTHFTVDSVSLAEYFTTHSPFELVRVQLWNPFEGPSLFDFLRSDPATALHSKLLAAGHDPLKRVLYVAFDTQSTVVDLISVPPNSGRWWIIRDGLSRELLRPVTTWVDENRRSVVTLNSHGQAASIATLQEVWAHYAEDGRPHELVPIWSDTCPRPMCRAFCEMEMSWMRCPLALNEVDMLCAISRLTTLDDGYQFPGRPVAFLILSKYQTTSTARMCCSRSPVEFIASPLTDRLPHMILCTAPLSTVGGCVCWVVRTLDVVVTGPLLNAGDSAWPDLRNSDALGYASWLGRVIGCASLRLWAWLCYLSVGAVDALAVGSPSSPYMHGRSRSPTREVISRCPSPRIGYWRPERSHQLNMVVTRSECHLQVLCPFRGWGAPVPYTRLTDSTQIMQAVRRDSGTWAAGFLPIGGAHLDHFTVVLPLPPAPLAIVVLHHGDISRSVLLPSCITLRQAHGYLALLGVVPGLQILDPPSLRRIGGYEDEVVRLRNGDTFELTAGPWHPNTRHHEALIVPDLQPLPHLNVWHTTVQVVKGGWATVWSTTDDDSSCRARHWVPDGSVWSPKWLHFSVDGGPLAQGRWIPAAYLPDHDVSFVAQPDPLAVHVILTQPYDPTATACRRLLLDPSAERFATNRVSEEWQLRPDIRSRVVVPWPRNGDIMVPRVRCNAFTCGDFTGSAAVPSFGHRTAPCGLLGFLALAAAGMSDLLLDISRPNRPDRAAYLIGFFATAVLGRCRVLGGVLLAHAATAMVVPPVEQQHLDPVPVGKFPWRLPPQQRVCGESVLTGTRARLLSPFSGDGETTDVSPDTHVEDVRVTLSGAEPNWFWEIIPIWPAIWPHTTVYVPLPTGGDLVCVVVASPEWQLAVLIPRRADLEWLIAYLRRITPGPIFSLHPPLAARSAEVSPRGAIDWRTGDLLMAFQCRSTGATYELPTFVSPSHVRHVAIWNYDFVVQCDLPLLIWRIGRRPSETVMPPPARWVASEQTFTGRFGVKYPGRWVPVPWAHTDRVALCQCAEASEHCNIILETCRDWNLQGECITVSTSASRYSLSQLTGFPPESLSLLGQGVDSPEFPPLRDGDTIFSEVEPVTGQAKRSVPGLALAVLLCGASYRGRPLALIGLWWFLPDTWVLPESDFSIALRSRPIRGQARTRTAAPALEVATVGSIKNMLYWTLEQLACYLPAEGSPVWTRQNEEWVCHLDEVCQLQARLHSLWWSRPLRDSLPVSFPRTYHAAWGSFPLWGCGVPDSLLVSTDGSGVRGGSWAFVVWACYKSRWYRLGWDGMDQSATPWCQNLKQAIERQQSYISELTALQAAAIWCLSVIDRWQLWTGASPRGITIVVDNAAALQVAAGVGAAGQPAAQHTRALWQAVQSRIATSFRHVHSHVGVMANTLVDALAGLHLPCPLALRESLPSTSNFEAQLTAFGPYLWLIPRCRRRARRNCGSGRFYTGVQGGLCASVGEPGHLKGQYGCEVWVRPDIVSPPLTLSSWRILVSTPRIVMVTCTDDRLPLTVCSAHAPHAERPDAEATLFWQELKLACLRAPSHRGLVLGIDANADFFAPDDEEQLIGTLLAAGEPHRNDMHLLELCIHLGLMAPATHAGVQIGDGWSWEHTGGTRRRIDHILCQAGPWAVQTTSQALDLDLGHKTRDHMPLRAQATLHCPQVPVKRNSPRRCTAAELLSHGADLWQSIREGLHPAHGPSTCVHLLTKCYRDFTSRLPKQAPLTIRQPYLVPSTVVALADLRDWRQQLRLVGQTHRLCCLQASFQAWKGGHAQITHVAERRDACRLHAVMSAQEARMSRKIHDLARRDKARHFLQLTKAATDLWHADGRPMEALTKLRWASRKAAEKRAVFAAGGYDIDDQLEEQFRSQEGGRLISSSQVCTQIALSGREPLHFKLALICALYKKGPAALPQNYRSIALLNGMAKVWHSYLRTTVGQSVLQGYAPFQLGGKRGIPVGFAVAAYRCAMDLSHAAGRSVAVLFIDIQAAYYEASRSLVFAGDTLDSPEDGLNGSHLQSLAQDLLNSGALELFGVPLEERSLLQDCVACSHWRLVTSERLFAATRGSRPGDGLADVIFGALFSIALRHIQRVCTAEGLAHHSLAAATGGDAELLQLGWADDLAILSDFERSFPRLASVAISTLQALKFRVNLGAGKTEALLDVRGPKAKQIRGEMLTGDSSIVLSPGVVLRFAPEYRYLGVVQTPRDTGRRDVELSARRACSAWAHGRSLLASTNLPWALKTSWLSGRVLPAAYATLATSVAVSARAWSPLTGFYERAARTLVGSWQFGHFLTGPMLGGVLGLGALQYPFVVQLPSSWHRFWRIWQAMHSVPAWSAPAFRAARVLRGLTVTDPTTAPGAPQAAPPSPLLDFLAATVSFRQVCSALHLRGCAWISGIPSSSGQSLLRSLLPSATFHVVRSGSMSVFVAAHVTSSQSVWRRELSSLLGASPGDASPHVLSETRLEVDDMRHEANELSSDEATAEQHLTETEDVLNDIEDDMKQAAHDERKAASSGDQAEMDARRGHVLEDAAKVAELRVESSKVQSAVDKADMKAKQVQSLSAETARAAEQAAEQVQEDDALALASNQVAATEAQIASLAGQETDAVQTAGAISHRHDDAMSKVAQVEETMRSLQEAADSAGRATVQAHDGTKAASQRAALQADVAGSAGQDFALDPTKLRKASGGDSTESSGEMAVDETGARRGGHKRSTESEELTGIKKDVRKHSDFIEQLRDNQEKIEDRLKHLEQRGHGSTATTTSEVGRPNLMILGGWPQDTQKDVLLTELDTCLQQLNLQGTFEDVFCTGPRRGFAMAFVAMQPSETGVQLKRRMITLAQQIQNAQVKAPSMGTTRTLKATLGKSKHERLISNHTGKTKRLILTISPTSLGAVETEYSEDIEKQWGELMSLCTNMVPQSKTPAKPGLAAKSLFLPKDSRAQSGTGATNPFQALAETASYQTVLEDLTLVQYRHDDDQWRGNAIGFGPQFQAQWDTPTSRPRRTKDLAKKCTAPRPGLRYRDPPDVKDLYAKAKQTGSENDWKTAHKARRKAQEEWRHARNERAADGHWQSYRSLKNSAGNEWTVHFVEAAEEAKQEPKRWTVQHFRTLFQKTELRDPPRWDKDIDTGRHFTIEDLRLALQKGKTNKAVGEDLVSFELIQALCEDSSTEESLLNWMERLRCGEALPREWLRTIVTLLPKNDKPRGPKDLRPISVGASAAKVFGTMLLMRTRRYIRPAGASQCAHNGRQTADYLYAAIKSFSLDTEWHLGLSWCRIDIQKAFDTLARDKTLQLLRDNLPPEMFLEYRCWERLFYEGTALLKTPWGDEEIPQGRGIRQGSVESPFLFSIAIEMALKTATEHAEWPSTIPSIPDLPLAELLYMDDTLLWAASRDDMVKKYNILKTELAKWGLRVNPEKTSYYHSPYSTTPGNITLDGQIIQPAANMTVFGIPLLTPLKPSALMDTAMSKMPWACIVMMLLIQGLGKHLLPTWAKQPDREEDEPRGPPRHPYPHYEHHENHDNEGMPDRASDTTAAEQAKEEEEVTNMAQTAMTLILSLPGARSFEEAFQGEIAPDWYWELVDAGGDLCRGGAKVDVIATKFGEAVLRRRENDMASYLTTEPIRNRLLRAWEIVCAHYQSVEVPLPVGFDVGPFAHNAEEIIHRHRGATVDRDQEEEPAVMHVGPDNDGSAQGTGLPGASDDQTTWLLPAQTMDLPESFWRAWETGLDIHGSFVVAHDIIAREQPVDHRLRALGRLREMAYPFGGYASSPLTRSTTTIMQGIGRDLASMCLNHNFDEGKENHTEETAEMMTSKEPEPNDEVGFMDDRWKEDESDPELETVDLEEDNPEMTTEDAMAVWQALLEMQQGEEFNIASPILPSHIADNIVETLVDRPEAQHNFLSDTLPLFLSRVHRDLARALERARNLRARLGRASSSTDPPRGPGPPEAEQEADEECLMQTTIQQSTAAAASREDLLLQRLHRAFQALDPGVASARALRLVSQLQDYDGPLSVDRSLLESLLVATNGETPPMACGDHLLLEHAWCATWWRRLRGIKEVTDEDVDEEYDELDRLLAQRDEQERAAEQAEHEADEAHYLRGLEAAVEHHHEAMRAARAQAEDDRALQQAMGYTRSRAKPRFCLGVCVTNGKMEKAWDFEVNPEAPVQVHIKAEMLEGRTQWYRAGEPVPASEVPQEVRDMSMPSSSSMPPPSQRQFDIEKPATRRLYERWLSREISPQAVVGIGGTGLLAYFHALTDIPDDVWTELGQRDTLTLAHPGQPGLQDRPPAGTSDPTTTSSSSDRPPNDIEEIPAEQSDPATFLGTTMPGGAAMPMAALASPAVTTVLLEETSNPSELAPENDSG